MTTETKNNDHYLCPDLISRIAAGLQMQGKSTDNLSIDDLAAVDEFHLRGPMATNDIIELLQPKADSHLIDLGSGLGGPARRFAAAIGCRVTGVDLSEDYCAAARELSRWLDLDGKTNFVHGDVTRLVGHDNAIYDGAFSIHVGMNIPDRSTFYQEACRVLKNEARFVLYDIVIKQENVTVKYPQPWALQASDSHLVTETQMVSALKKAGLSIETVRDDTSLAIEFLQTSITKAQQLDKPSPLSLGTLLGPVFKEILPNLAENLLTQNLRLVAVTAKKST